MTAISRRTCVGLAPLGALVLLGCEPSASTPESAKPMPPKASAQASVSTSTSTSTSASAQAVEELPAAQAGAIEFDVSLYFKGAPQLAKAKLLKAWRDEGYGIESTTSEADGWAVFRAADLTRGDSTVTIAQFLQLGKARPIAHTDLPAHYPAVSQLDIDYDATYLVNPNTALADFKAATHSMRLTMRMKRVPDLRLPHMELVGVLHHIHQLTPLHAIQLHHLDLLVGKVDLDEFLDYAVDYPGKAAQFCPMLAFGLFCTQQQGVATGWTKGLAQFNPRELWAQSRTQPPTALLRGLFNLGYSVSGGGAFKAGETASVGDLLVSFRDNPKLAAPFIEMVLP